MKCVQMCCDVHIFTAVCTDRKRKADEAAMTQTPEDIKLAHMFETLGLSLEQANEVLTTLKSVYVNFSKYT